MTTALTSRVSGSLADDRVKPLYHQLVDIEQRLIPTALHVFAQPSYTE